MEHSHRIAELLTAGAEPTESEARDLARVGEFTASLHARLLHGLDEAPVDVAGSRAGALAGDLSQRLSASTGTRWAEGMGLGASMLGAWSSGLWQIGASRPGYDGLDGGEMSTVELYDDEPAAPSPTEGARPSLRRRSMFGAPGRPGSAARMQRRARRAGGRGETLRLRGGDALSDGAFGALEAGGLYMDDQLAAPAQAAETRGWPTAVSLDGLRVDSRTPALAGALGWARAALSDERMARSGLAVHGPSIERMVRSGRVPTASQEASVRRPVYGFFDSVEGEFLSLVDEPAPVDSGAMTSASGAPGRRGASGATAQGEASTPTGVSLDRVVPPRAGAAPAVRPWSGGIFPPPPSPGGQSTEAGRLSAGDPFQRIGRRAAARTSEAAPWVATRVTHDVEGQATPRVSRGAMSAPRVSLSSWGAVAPAAGGVGSSPAASPGRGLQGTAERRRFGGAGADASPRWRLASDAGPDLPLAAGLSRHEATAGRISARGGAMAPGAEGFRPVVAGPVGADPRSQAAGGEALDGVVWLSLPVDESPLTGPGDMQLAAVPSGRRASMVPAAEALQLAPSPRPIGPVASTPGFAEPLRRPALAEPTGGVWRGPSSSPTIGYRGLAADFEARQLLEPAPGSDDTASEVAAAPARARRRDPGQFAVQRSAAPIGRDRAFSPEALAPRTTAAGARGRWAREARGARQALRRPVLTGREILATAALASPDGPILGAGGLGSSSASPHSPQAPALLSSLGARAGARMIRGGGPSTLGADMDSAGRLTHLAPAAAVQARRALRSGGWTETELAMLELAPHEGAAAEGEGAVQGRAGGPATPGRFGRGGQPLHAAGQPAPRGGGALQMVRNLARVLTGTESLSGVTAAGAGAPGAGADLLLGGHRPFGSPSIGAGYFGDAAPARSRVSPWPGLGDAMGELLALAGSAGWGDGMDRGDAASAGRPEGGGLVQRLERARSGVVGSRADALGRGGAVGSGGGEHLGGEGPGGPARGATPGYGRMAAQARDLVAPELGAAAEGEGRAGVGARLASALGVSSRGPAGVERLAGGTIQRREAGGVADGAGDVRLGAVMAPEAMLGTLGGDAGASDAPVQRGTRGELPGELARTGSEPPTAGAGGAPGDAGRAGRGGGGSAATRRASRVVQLLERSGIRGEGAQDAMVRTMVRSLSRGDTVVGGHHGDLADFAMAWLGRVDGNRTGLDLDMGDLRGDFGRVFAKLAGGRGRPSGVAEGSPIFDAGVVAHPSARPSADDAGRGGGADRSGLRRIVREMGRGGSTGARPQQRAAQQASRQTNWRFVETGSDASTSHADLGRLAETVLDAPDATERVPLPLVAPAVKAVAQTAMRKPRTEDPAGGGSRSAPSESGASGGGEPAQRKAELGKEAFERLALEMADRIARRMKRDKERRGIWP